MFVFLKRSISPLKLKLQKSELEAKTKATTPLNSKNFSEMRRLLLSKGEGAEKMNSLGFTLPAETSYRRRIMPLNPIKCNTSS